MAKKTTDPMSLLRKMQQASNSEVLEATEEVQLAQLWSGVGFKVKDIRLVTPLNQVTEVLICPEMTPVPTTRSWVRGIANVRGTLLTIIDLSEFFGGEPIYINNASRVLVMNVEGFSSGLLVNEAFGLRHFDEETEKQNIVGLDDPILMNTRGAFLRDNVLWGIFDMKMLAQNPAFLRVAA